MIIQPTAKLAFHTTELDSYDINGTRWARLQQIVAALGMERRAGQQLFKRHRSEFTREMTDIITVPSAGGAQQTRVFSPRGAMRFAMLANTPKSAAFRDWASDVLEGKQPALAAPAYIPPPSHPFADPRDVQIRTLQAQLIKTNPRWQLLARYKAANLSNTEIGKLLGVSRSTAGAYVRDMRACGLLPATTRQLGLFHAG
jgi:hypothetical protein